MLQKEEKKKSVLTSNVLLFNEFTEHHTLKCVISVYSKSLLECQLEEAVSISFLLYKRVFSI